jgi:hypothetical protein
MIHWIAQFLFGLLLVFIVFGIGTVVAEWVRMERELKRRWENYDRQT